MTVYWIDIFYYFKNRKFWLL